MGPSTSCSSSVSGCETLQLSSPGSPPRTVTPESKRQWLASRGVYRPRQNAMRRVFSVSHRPVISHGQSIQQAVIYRRSEWECRNYLYPPHPHTASGIPSFFLLPVLREIVGYIGLRTSGRYRLSLPLRTEFVSPILILFSPGRL